MAVAPVLQVYAEAALGLCGQQVNGSVSQPVFSSWFAKAGSVLAPATVKAHRAVASALKHRPASTWWVETHSTRLSRRYRLTSRVRVDARASPSVSMSQ